MQPQAALQPIVEETGILPDLGTVGRYVVSATLGLTNQSTSTDDIKAALDALEGFAARYIGDREAHADIFDRVRLKQVDRWWGDPKFRAEPAPHPMIAIYERLIASGAPVSLIGPRGRADFGGAA